MPGEAVSPCVLQDPVVSPVPCKEAAQQTPGPDRKSFLPAISAQHLSPKKLNTMPAGKRKKIKRPRLIFHKAGKKFEFGVESISSTFTFYLIFCLLHLMLIHFVNLNEFLHLLGVYTPLGNIASTPGILWMRVQFLGRSWYCSPGSYEMGSLSTSTAIDAPGLGCHRDV